MIIKRGKLKSALPCLFISFSLITLLTIGFFNCAKKRNPTDYMEKSRTTGALMSRSLTLEALCNDSTSCIQEELAAEDVLADLPSANSSESCVSNSNFDTCLFFKNPVVSKGSAFSKTANNTMNLSLYQRMGVNLDPATIESTTGCLSNASYTIYKNAYFNSSNINTWDAIIATKSCFSNFDFKVQYNGYDSQLKTAQIMPHYYLNFQK